ncbi:MAG: glucuronate isomerase [Planctomycetaceae bacterium]|nr:glucuronate isomerase [Planctomycetaceae bacterium]
MTKPFITDNFMLNSPSAERLYHEYAEAMPICDYHSHLPVNQILDDASFENLTQVWLYGDHYKWRAMRACGFPETLVSGIPEAADDYARFEAWAATVPQAVGNPLYHWTHLELKRYFDIDLLLSPATAREIYDECGRKLKTPEFSVRSLIRRSNVATVCTTDDPGDDLLAHSALAAEKWVTGVYPAWRPDKALAADQPAFFNQWLENLKASEDTAVDTYAGFREVLWARHEHFHRQGCRLSDYGIERPYAVPYTMEQVEAAFVKLRSGFALEGLELERFRSAVLYDCLVMDAEQGWTQQLHFGAKRNNRSSAFALRGPDTGYDSMGEFPIGDGLVALLDRLDRAGKLTKTIIYVLNPKDNDMIASIIGSFQGDVPGKMQFGTAWWHNDHKDGMLRQMSALASMGLLSRFVGMLTDSRSFLSYPRHEYFRRLLCHKLGTEMDAGEIPMDFDLVGNMVKDICYNNAVEYFKFGK